MYRSWPINWRTVNMKKQIKQNYQIDMSGKIEQTNKNTVVAISNSKTFTLLIKTTDKRLLQKMYRNLFNKQRQYVYEVFSALVYLSLMAVKPNSRIVIDREYPGQEGLLKLLILEYDLGSQIVKSENIDFGLVGKRSSAHKLAYQTFKKQKKPDKIVAAKDITEVIFPSKKTGYSSINRTKGS